MKKVIKLIFPMALGAMMLLSCSEKPLNEEKEIQKITSKDGVVSVLVENSAIVTKSGGKEVKASIVADLSEKSGIEGLVLEETVTSLDGSGFKPATKGTPVYTENFADVFGSGFVATSVYDATTKEPVEGLTPAIFVKDEQTGYWSHDFGSKAVPAKSIFIFSAPETVPAYIGTPGYDTEKGAITFALDADKFPTTAQAQSDVLFTCSEIEKGTANSIRFNHVFTGVKFKQSNTEDDFQITKIEISNMVTSGTCTITPVKESSSADISKWTHPEETVTTATFSQTYDGTITLDPSDKYFGESFYDGTTAQNNLNLAEDTKATTTFMCVPQTFSEEDASPVIVTIYYTIGGKESQTEVNFSKTLNGKEWKAGELYTYSFKVTDLGVSVDDSASGDTKENVVITNTGNTSGFIRAAIVANWVVTDGSTGEEKIVKGWEISDGVMEEPGSDWILGEDGYYYYKYGVSGGNATKQAIFKSYTLTAGAAPYTDAVFRMSIIAQIVKDRSEWTSAPTGLSTDVEK